MKSIFYVERGAWAVGLYRLDDECFPIGHRVVLATGVTLHQFTCRSLLLQVMKKVKR